MFKLDTPLGLLLTTALLAIFSAYAFMIGSIEDSVPLLAGGGVAVVATYGTATMRPWSQYLVYVLTLGFMLKLGHSIYRGWTSGYFSYQFDSSTEIAWALAPSAAMAVLSWSCCWFVYKHFRNTSARLTRSIEPLRCRTASQMDVDTSSRLR